MRPNSTMSTSSPSVLYTSHMAISVKYSWSVHTWLGTLKVKMSVEGRRPLSAIQRPMRRCHQKSGSCSTPVNSDSVTIITAPRSSVRAVSRSVSRNALLSAAERVGEIARDAPGILWILLRKGVRQDTLFPVDAQELAGDEVHDRRSAQPAGRCDVDADGGEDLADVHRVPAERVRAARDEPARFGHDGEGASQVCQPPDRVHEANGGEHVSDQDQALATSPAGKEARAYSGESSAERDKDHGHAMIGAPLWQPDGVKDEEHREVGERERLLDDEKHVVRSV